MLNPTRNLLQTRTSPILKCRQGHRVISQRSAEIVPRWEPNPTRNLLQIKENLNLYDRRESHSRLSPSLTRPKGVFSQRISIQFVSYLTKSLDDLLQTRRIPILKCLARTSSDFGAQRRNSIEMGTSPNHSMTFCKPDALRMSLIPQTLKYAVHYFQPPHTCDLQTILPN